MSTLFYFSEFSHLVTSIDGNGSLGGDVSSLVASDVLASEVNYRAVIQDPTIVSDRLRSDVGIRERLPGRVLDAVDLDGLQIPVTRNGLRERDESDCCVRKGLHCECVWTGDDLL